MLGSLQHCSYGDVNLLACQVAPGQRAFAIVRGCGTAGNLRLAMTHVVAIDAGTTGVRALVVDEAGRVVDLAYRELTQHFPHPGWVEHDPDDIWHAVVATLGEVPRNASPVPPVAALGITNQRETAVAWDRRTGRPLHRAIVWQDRRTARRCAALVRAGHLPLVRARTGLVFDPYFSATKFEWLLAHGVAPVPGSRARHRRLVGLVEPDRGAFATDVSNASRTMLFDIASLRWDDELCELFGVPRRRARRGAPSAGRFGTVTGGAPLRRGARVGDRRRPAGGPLRPGLLRAGDAKVTYGTGSLRPRQRRREPPCRPPTVSSPPSPGTSGRHGGAEPLSYALEGSAFVSGAAIQWLRDGLGVISDAAQVGPLAASVPDAGGVTFVPAFTGLGSPWWDPEARGTVTGITRGSTTAHLARATVEAIAFQVRDILDAMATATGRPLGAVRADGGASAMDLLLQMQADQCQMTVARPAMTESTALGAATLAGLAEGVWGSTAEIARQWRLDAEFAPSLPPAVADASHAAWLRSVERARGLGAVSQCEAAALPRATAVITGATTSQSPIVTIMAVTYPKGRMPTVLCTMPATSIRIHALTKKSGPANTTRTKELTGPVCRNICGR